MPGNNLDKIADDFYLDQQDAKCMYDDYGCEIYDGEPFFKDENNKCLCRDCFRDKAMSFIDSLDEVELANILGWGVEICQI